jgi:hypothetical protein
MLVVVDTSSVELTVVSAVVDISSLVVTVLEDDGCTVLLLLLLRTTPNAVPTAPADDDKDAGTVVGRRWRPVNDDAANAVRNGVASGGRDDVAIASIVANR